MFSALSHFVLTWQSYLQELGVVGLLTYALLMVALQMVCGPLSPLSIAAGLIFGVTDGFIAVEIGTVLGAAVNFLISRHFARAQVNRWLGHHEKIKLIDAAIGREGWKIVALLRFCPIPFGLANYAYGLTAVAFAPYLLTSAVAIIPANLFFVWFGATSQEALTLVHGGGKAPAGQTIFTVVGLAAFFIALTYVAKIARTAVARGEISPAPTE